MSNTTTEVTAAKATKSALVAALVERGHGSKSVLAKRPVSDLRDLYESGATVEGTEVDADTLAEGQVVLSVATGHLSAKGTRVTGRVRVGPKHVTVFAPNGDVLLWVPRGTAVRVAE